MVKSRLNAHSKLHKDPFKCDLCEYKAMNINTLERHSRVHTGERPFECDQCEYKAKEKGTLDKHKRRVHADERTKTDENPFKCKHCYAFD